MHPSTFEYVKPTEDQMEAMVQLRKAAKLYADHLVTYLPEGSDKTYTLRKLREVAMWANIALTRHTDGSPRAPDDAVDVREYPADHPVEGDLGSVPL
jgi:hypothetical protein